MYDDDYADPFLTRSRLVFGLVFALVAVAFLVWSGTGRPFPGQRLAPDVANLADPAIVTGQWGLVPAPPGGIDLAPMVPLENWDGYALAYVNNDGLVLVSFTGSGDPEPDPKLAVERVEGMWRMQVGNQTGLAVVWPIRGNRHGGLVLWGAALPDDATVVVPALAQVVRETGV